MVDSIHSWSFKSFSLFQLSRTAQDHLYFFRSLSSVLLLSFNLSVRKNFRCSFGFHFVSGLIRTFEVVLWKFLFLLISDVENQVEIELAILTSDHK